MINDHQTELYIGVSSSGVCKLPIDEMLSLNYTSTTPPYILFQEMNVVSLLALQKNQLLSIKKNNNLYYFTD